MSNPKRRKNLHEKCPYCFWCGVLTVYIDPNAHPGPPPDNLATIDHIRSRNIPNRAEKPNNWQPGITVLSCTRCNVIRGKHEANFLREIDQELFYDKGNTRPKPELDFHTLHANIAHTLQKTTTEELLKAFRCTKKGKKLINYLNKLKEYRLKAQKPNEKPTQPQENST